jgi:dTDP-4-dehydrorhamnose reductase
MSSVDVYPKGLSECTENFKLNPLDLQGKYPRCKLLSEDLVKRHGKNVLILRLSAMLGVDTCQNSLKKMFDGQGLTVSSHSTFNYILHEDVGLFLKHCFSKKVQGVFNLASMSKVSLDEIKTKYNLRNINFGHYLYNTQNISTKKVGSECLFFQKTSIQVVEYFINHLWSKK